MNVASMHERALVELTQWFGRVQQYSAAHPACRELGTRAHATLSMALEASSPLTITVAKDTLGIGDGLAVHPLLRGRLAAHLHERGVATMRFAGGVSLEELSSLLELLTLPVQTTFDRGGLSELVKERGVVRIAVEDLSHDISADERQAQRLRTRLRTDFKDLLAHLRAQRELHGTGEHVRALLDNPLVAVALLEENPLAVAEAVAGLCLLVREEEERTGEALAPKLHVILMMLSPAARDRVVLGIAPLAGEFRDALVWGQSGLTEEELARFVLPALRRNAADLETVFYALGLATPHDGRRIAMVRFLALRLHDLPADDAAASELLALLAEPAPAFGSSMRERDELQPYAERVLAMRRGVVPEGSSAPRDSGRSRSPLDTSRTMYELVRMSGRTRRFAQLCTALPLVAARYANAGAVDAVLGIVRALEATTRPEIAELARRTLVDVVSVPVAAQILRELDLSSTLAEGTELEQLTSDVKVLAALRPDVVLERLELSESRKMRRVVLDALASVGPRIAPHVRAKIHSPQWYVVRNVVTLLPACGATASDYAAVARHPNEKVRAELLRALRTVTLDEGTNGVLVDLALDGALESRARALSLVRGELLGPRAIARLDELLRDEAQPEELKRRVVVVLGRSGQDEAAAALFAVIQPRGLLDLGALRDAAADALATSPAPGARAYFDEGLRSSVWRVRRACEKAAEKARGR